MRACTNTARAGGCDSWSKKTQASREKSARTCAPTHAARNTMQNPRAAAVAGPIPCPEPEALRDPPGREPGAPAKLIAPASGQNENAASCGRRSGQCAARGAVAMDTHHRVADAFLPYLVAMCSLRDSDRQGCWACEATLLFSSAPSGGTTNARVPHRRWLQQAMPSRYRRSVQHMILGKSP